MNHNEKLLKLVRLQDLLQELNVLEDQIKETNHINNFLSFHNFTNHQCCKYVPKLSSAQKKARFAEACREALKHFHPSAIVEDHKQLCAQVDMYLETNSSKTFWSHVQTTIPEKTTTQLKEYFQKCFSKVKFEESISEEDKAVLKDLSSQMKDRRPAQVTDHFIKCRQSNPYFKRTIIMFVVSLRK
ncbi:Hypothetical_protein [Hexamita inflata]|uniref:Hypothetical_protein n=1 Tax=Hexamita inflata TaxID=28002 RepID=A0AA86PRB8_9EUKA|nr:Hypothetical protein HINF_LOCUS29633 [Hexamita inflata]